MNFIKIMKLNNNYVMSFFEKMIKVAKEQRGKRYKYDHVFDPIMVRIRENNAILEELKKIIEEA